MSDMDFSFNETSYLTEEWEWPRERRIQIMVHVRKATLEYVMTVGQEMLDKVIFVDDERGVVGISRRWVPLQDGMWMHHVEIVPMLSKVKPEELTP